METITLKRDPKDAHLLENFFGKKKLAELRSLKSNDPQERKKIYYDDPRWKKMSSELRKEKPGCTLCGKPSKDVHHLLKFADQFEEDNKYHLLLDKENCICLCKECHNAIHAGKLNPNQKLYIDGLKNLVYNKYQNVGILLRYTEDINH